MVVETAVFQRSYVESFVLHFVGVIEVLKVMKELGVTADVETFQNYILPTFPSMDAAQQALEVSVCVSECARV